jgi:ATP-dependent DNA helicase RecG
MHKNRQHKVEDRIVSIHQPHVRPMVRGKVQAKWLHCVRCCLMPSLAHRDYSKYYPVQISVYEDKIMCWNPGELPEGWSADTLLTKHASLPFNPAIANVFFRAGLIEAWGRGFEKILLTCQGKPNLHFEVRYEPTGLWLIFNFEPRLTSVETSVEISVETSKAIIQLISAKPDITLAEIASKIGKTLRAIEMATSKLRKEGKIKFIGPKKNGHWQILI